MSVSRVLACASGLLLLAHAIVGVATGSQEEQVDTLSIEEVIKAEQEHLLSLPGVVGVGEGLCNEEPCIKLFIISPPGSSDILPRRIGSYPVDWVFTGGEFESR